MEAIEGSETPAFETQKPGKYPQENILHKEHGEILKSRKQIPCLSSVISWQYIHTLHNNLQVTSY